MLQLIKEAVGQNGVTPRDDSPVTEVLNQVCPSSWRGACKTAVQLLFAQAGLVSTGPGHTVHSVDCTTIIVDVTVIGGGVLWSNLPRRERGWGEKISFFHRLDNIQQT